jgi:hypothetical protein
MIGNGGAVGALVASIANIDFRPVRIVAFDKNEQTNWSLGWHQDRTIAVKERIETPGFGPWSKKQGLLHVTPPTTVLDQMITVRIHVDDCPADNAPLRVALGSHLLGLTPADRASDIANGCKIIDCLAEAGDIWVYKTLILHASDAAAQPRRRRVIQIDYTNVTLPEGLEWAS